MRNQIPPMWAVKEVRRRFYLHLHLDRACRVCFVSEKQKKTLKFKTRRPSRVTCSNWKGRWACLCLLVTSRRLQSLVLFKTLTLVLLWNVTRYKHVFIWKVSESSCQGRSIRLWDTWTLFPKPNVSLKHIRSAHTSVFDNVNCTKRTCFILLKTIIWQCKSV
jgi:hypothetical protein